MNAFVGQQNAVERIELALNANDVFPHTLLFGGAGLGKTTLANIIAKENGGNLYTYTAPAIRTQQDLINIILQLTDGDILFIDEIHRLKVEMEELLYPVLEDSRLDIRVGIADYQQMIQIPLPKITIIGATTISGLLTKPFMDRFEMLLNLQFYNADDLTLIIKESADKLKMKLTDQIVASIVSRSRNTPRIANNLLKNMQKINKTGNISLEDASKTYSLMDIDDNGFSTLDRRYLKALIDIFDCKPAGIASIASALCESKETLQQHVEPYLLHSGYISRTAKGRVLLPKGLSLKL